MKRFVLYHGSNKKIIKPEFQYHKNHNDMNKALDFGDAFYCTLDENEGKEWSCKDGYPGILNKYLIDTRYLKNIVDLTKYNNEESVLTWVAILINFRLPTMSNAFKEKHEKRIKFLLDNYYPKDLLENADIIIAFRADDAYFRFPRNFIEGSITLETLSYAFNNGFLGKQYVLLSKKAFNATKFIDSYPVNNSYVDKYKKRIKDANDNYERKQIDDENNNNGKYINDLIKEEKDNDKRK